jgi:hydroxyacylglutathione hydrolase
MEIKSLIVSPILTNCYILISEKELAQPESKVRFKETAIIDPGGNAKEILKEIEKNTTRLKYIILTHSHWDHVFAVKKLKKETGAKVLIHEAEKNSLKFKIDKFLAEGDEVKVGNVILKTIHTPGHTKDSICLLGKDFIFTGDTLFRMGVGRTDLPGGSQEELERSLQKLSKILKPGMRVYPGHGEIFEYVE